MSTSLFGTDGIRGRVGTFPIDPESMVRLGHGIARVLSSNQQGFRVLLGKDTRLSGYMLESALESGLISAGVDVILTGPLPTPAVGYLTETLRADLGIVISASHNPYMDNGVKLILPSGEKLDPQQSRLIEQYLYQPVKMFDATELGRATRLDGATQRYAERCKSKLNHVKDLSGLKVVLDCANGATYQVAKMVFEELNAKVHVINDQPNGYNINLNSGSTCPDLLVREVVRTGSDCGLAFDGDGDRLIMVDSEGTVLDGDDILWCLSNNDKRYFDLSGVVKTVMSNGALEQHLSGRNIGIETVPVGDHYVMKKLKEQGWILGAEPSGHILSLDASQMGDAIISGILVVETMLLSGKPLSALRLPDKFPQVQGNINLPLDVDRDMLNNQIRAFERSINDEVKVVIRPSGTEPKLRYLFESEKADLAKLQNNFYNWFSDLNFQTQIDS